MTALVQLHLMSEKRSEPTVPIETMRGSFSNHISDSNNRRIMFSAPFGAGKSFFLNEFFDSHNKFMRVTLNPVDYSVSSNEDIIEIIKYDILYELASNFSDQIQLVKEDFEPIMLAQVFAKEKMKIFQLLKLFTSILSTSSGGIVDVAEELTKTKEDFENFSKDINIDEENGIIKYLARHKFKKGSIREEDEITAMIKDFICRVKESCPNQELVLVVDDLDRLDPEHVFRLFNVFTAHHDSRTERNKFNFDRIIFVCDIENIRHMFHHKFGPSVDFAGYIDKFFSKEIFEFDLKRFLKEKAVHYLNRNKGYYESQFDDGAVPTDIYKRYEMSKNGGRFSTVLLSILEDMIDGDMIKTRNFDKLIGYTIPNYSFKIVGGVSHQSHDFYFLVLIHNLRQFYPSYIDLLNAFKILSNNFVEDTGRRNESILSHSVKNHLIGYAARMLMSDKDFDRNTTAAEDIDIKCADKSGNLVSLCLRFNNDQIDTFIGVFDSNSLPAPNRLAQKMPDHYHYMYLALKKVIQRRILN